MGDNLRVLIALKLSALAGWLVGNRPLSEPEEIRTLRRALGEVTTLVPFDHPACRVALKALAGEEAGRG